ncbi:MAG TPA: hypothetical protein VL463_23095 [Kofleriaceae bacterium]|jgi:hypothetical protein|nr:hypothetical protein [Kofleriaceae bacterium]
MRIWIASLLFAAACGGKTTVEQPYDTHSHGVGEHHDMEMEHHGVGVAEIDTFHETLAPVWHAPEGDQRHKDACAAVPKMKEQAAAIVGRARADHAGWEGNANALVTAVDKLGESCAGTGDGFDEKFSAVHDAYHALMESAMGKEGETDHAQMGH